MTEEENTATTTEEFKSGQLAIQKIYVKDISFEAPNSPETFIGKWEPKIKLDITNKAKTLEKKLYEVILGLTLTVKSSNKTAYLIEAQQAGIFHIDQFPKDIVAQMLATTCPNILFPFARELVADLVSRGGFPQLLLAPVNFDALYRHQQEVLRQNANDQTIPETRH